MDYAWNAELGWLVGPGTRFVSADRVKRISQTVTFVETLGVFWVSTTRNNWLVGTSYPHQDAANKLCADSHVATNTIEDLADENFLPE